MDKIKGKRAIIIVTGIALVVVLGIIVGVSVLSRYTDYKDKIDALVFADINLSAVADGTYTGEYDADVIYAKVQVTVSGGEITDIDILEHRNERGGPAEAITDDMIAQQRLDVDAVTSATYSSKTIRKAVENALLGSTE